MADDELGVMQEIADVRVRLKKANRNVPKITCRKLTRKEVPTPPRRVRDGVVDQDGQRWRFDQKGKLSTYIVYDGAWLADKENLTRFPWVALWVPEYG